MHPHSALNTWLLIVGPDLEVAASSFPLGVIPPLEGGRIFREISMRHSCPDGVCADAARRLGLWQSEPKHVLQAVKVLNRESNRTKERERFERFFGAFEGEDADELAAVGEGE